MSRIKGLDLLKMGKDKPKSIVTKKNPIQWLCVGDVTSSAMI